MPSTDLRLPHYAPPIDERVANHPDLVWWLIPHSGNKPLIGFKDRGPINPSLLKHWVERFGGDQRAWYLRLPPGWLVIDPDSPAAKTLVERLIAQGDLPDSPWKVQSRRGIWRFYRIDYSQGKRQLKPIGLDIITNWNGNQGMNCPDGISRKTLPGFGEGEPPYLPETALVNLIEEALKHDGKIPHTRRESEWAGEGRSLEWQERSGPYVHRPASSDLPLGEYCAGRCGKGCLTARNSMLLKAGNNWGFRAARKRTPDYQTRQGPWDVPDLEEFERVLVGYARKHFCREHWAGPGPNEVYLESSNKAGSELKRIAQSVRDFVLANATYDGFLASCQRNLQLARERIQQRLAAQRLQAWMNRSMGTCVKDTARKLGVSLRTISRWAPQRGPRTEKVHAELASASSIKPFPLPRPGWGCRHH